MKAPPRIRGDCRQPLRLRRHEIAQLSSEDRVNRFSIARRQFLQRHDFHARDANFQIGQHQQFRKGLRQLDSERSFDVRLLPKTHRERHQLFPRQHDCPSHIDPFQGGVDIIAHRDELGFEPPIIKVQVKSKEGSSGDPEVSQLYGKLDRDEKALFITLGTFTTSAKTFARGRSNLRLIDGEVLVDLILAHYEEFDSKYKAIVPLKRVYAPDREAE